MSKRRIVLLGLVLVGIAIYARRQPRHVAAIVTDRTLQLGNLELSRCDADHQRAIGVAYCGAFDVPEDWDTPQGRHLQLRFQVIASSSHAPEHDLVVPLAGGPGQAAMQSFDAEAQAYEPLLKHRHVLLLDQRGTGESHSLACPKDDADDLTQPDVVLEHVRTQTKACLNEIAKTSDPRFYTTTDAIRDLEALRTALGAPLFDLIGTSYGTRVAQQYLVRHPEGVRSVVLDGVVPNTQTLGDRTAVDLEAALKKQLALCTADASCKARFGDPYETLQKVRTTLREHPQRVTFRDPLTHVERTHMLGEQGVAGLVRLFTYGTETAALMPLVLDEAQQGRYEPLMGQIALVESQLDHMSEGMQLSVVCAEDADLLVPHPEDKALLLGDTLIASEKAQCELWPHGKRPPDFHWAVHSDKPVLILSGELDPVTPPANGDEVLRTLTNARHLVAHGHGHGSMVRGCMPRVVARFVESLQPRALDVSCLDSLGALPAFTSFDGAGR